MTIREFQSKLAASPAASPLFAALRRLQAVESLQTLRSDDVTRDPTAGSFQPAGDANSRMEWILWGAAAASGLPTRAG